MEYESIIQELERNLSVYKELLSGLSSVQYLWKPAPEKWCLLEIICHLYDEERDDFKARVKHILENPNEPMNPIDPPSWVIDRSYIGQDFNDKLQSFLNERNHSIQWLRSLKNPKWDNIYVHSKLGEMSAVMMLSNWLAHDYMHFRQINNVKYLYLKETGKEPLYYAGDW